MKGFIFGFQRFVWCPKWTPASNNSGTNSVVSAIREIPEGELPERDTEDATSPARAQPEIPHSGDVHRTWMLLRLPTGARPTARSAPARVSRTPCRRAAGGFLDTRRTLLSASNRPI